MTTLKEKNILITGAAHGIGASLCKIFAREKSNLCMVDFDEAELYKAAASFRAEGVTPVLIIKDLSICDERIAIFSELREIGFKVDILVNNVGIGYWRYFQNSPWEKIEKIIDTNIKCITHMTKLFLPDMVKRGSGYLVNLSSTAAFIGAPNAVCYSATKAYIHIFSETLEMELRNTGVRILSVFPGATATHFWQYAGMSESAYDRKVDKMSSDKVAEEIVRAIKNGNSSVIMGYRNKFNVFAARFLPRKLLKAVAVKRFE